MLTSNSRLFFNVDEKVSYELSMPPLSTKDITNNTSSLYVFVVIFFAVYTLTIPFTLSSPSVRLVWAAICMIFVFVAVYFNPLLSFLLFLFSKPIIEMSWDQSVAGTYSLLDLSGIFPLLLMFYLVVIEKVRLIRRRNILWLSLSLFLLFAFIKIFIFFNQKEVFLYFEKSMRLTNSISALILFPLLIKSDQDYRKLLFILLTLGITPLLFLLMQDIGVISLRTQSSASGDIRIIGFYHDVVNQRYYFSAGLIASIGSLILNKNNKFLIVALSCLYIYGLILGYSKASTAFILALPLVLMTLRRNIRSMIPIFTLAMTVSLLLSQSGYLAEIFTKEIAVTSDEMEVDGALNGRVKVWQEFWVNFLGRPLLEQLIGSKAASGVSFRGGLHNDFLLNLGYYGIIGLLLYCFVVLSMVYIAFLRFQVFLDKTAHLDTAIFVSRAFVVLWLIDSVGLHPSSYPTLMLFVFGAIGVTDVMINRLQYNSYSYMHPVGKSVSFNVLI